MQKRLVQRAPETKIQNGGDRKLTPKPTSPPTLPTPLLLSLKAYFQVIILGGGGGASHLKLTYF